MPTRIKILLALHLLAMPSGAIVAAEYHMTLPDPLAIVVVSLALSDTGLLGLWGGMGKTRWWLRSGCIAVSIICLAAAISMADVGRFEIDVDIVVIVALPAIIVVCFLLLLQRKAGLLLTDSAFSPEGPDEFQFSLAHMLAATAIIAAALAIRTGLQRFGYDLHILTLIVCITLINVAAIWGALGRHRTSLRLLIVVPAGFVAGLIFPLLLSGPSGKFLMGEENVLFSAIFGGQSLIIAATLLVCRSCGWRLRRATSEDLASADEVAGEDSEPAAIINN